MRPVKIWFQTKYVIYFWSALVLIVGLLTIRDDKNVLSSMNTTDMSCLLFYEELFINFGKKD